MATNDRRLLYKYKGDSCEYCGTTVEEKVRIFKTIAGFNFHHLDPEKKAPDYDNLIRRKLSSKHFDEVDKCALLCRNCHDTLHGQDITIPVEVTLECEGIEPIKHEIKCQVICNYEKQEGTMFSDDFSLLQLYRVSAGKDGDSVMSGIQLKASLGKAIYRTQKAGPLIVCDINSGQELFHAEPADAKHVRIKYKLEFPVVSSAITLGTKDKKDHTNFYLRPGQLVAKVGDNDPILSQALGRITMSGTLEYDAFAKQ